MKKIELFERAIAEQAGSLKDYGINGTMFWAYRKSIDAGNDLIDFNEVMRTLMPSPSACWKTASPNLPSAAPSQA